MAQKHYISVVTSIHQPNSDVLMLFDQLYVLAKNGRCVYEGAPHNLIEHLRRADIECYEYQVPIEVLLKVASRVDATLDVLVNQVASNKAELVRKCQTEGKYAPNGVPLNKASFNLKHLIYLFMRTTTYTFRSQWKAMLMQLVFILVICALVTQLFNKHVGEIDGCFSFDTPSNTSCLKTKESLRIESLLSQNLRLQFFTEVLIQFLLIVATTLIFASEVRVFFNEHKNGKTFVTVLLFTDLLCSELMFRMS